MMSYQDFGMMGAPHIKKRRLEEDAWVEIVRQLHNTPLNVARMGILTSNIEMLEREDIPLSVTSRLLNLLVDELIVSDDANLRSKAGDLLIHKMSQIFGNQNQYDPSPFLSAIELQLNSCLNVEIRVDLVKLLNLLLDILPDTIMLNLSLLNFISKRLCQMRRSQLSQSSVLSGFAAMKELQLARDNFFAKVFLLGQNDGICHATCSLDRLRNDLLLEMLQECSAWDCKDFDFDLKISGISLIIHLCSFSGIEGEVGRSKSLREAIQNTALCSILKKYILGGKEEQDIGLHGLQLFIEFAGKTEVQILLNHDFPTVLLEALKPKSDSAILILGAIRNFVGKSCMPSFSGRNPLDASFDLGAENFWKLGNNLVENGDVVSLMHWYSVVEEILSSTIILRDLDCALDACCCGLAVCYNPEVLNAMWTCMIRFCSHERIKNCKTLGKALVKSCTLLRISEENKSFALFLHENALYTFLNCLKSVVAHGWSLIDEEERQELLHAIQTDVFQVVPDRTVAAFYEVLHTVLECGVNDPRIESGTKIWCDKIARAGFVSTVIESLSSVSVNEAVAAKASRLLHRFLTKLGFIEHHHQNHFDVLVSAGSFRGFFFRLSENQERGGWSISSSLVAAAVLAGLYTYQDFQTITLSDCEKWLTATAHKWAFYLVGEYEESCEIDETMEHCLTRNLLCIETSIADAARRHGQPRRGISCEDMLVLLKAHEKSGRMSHSSMIQVILSYSHDSAISETCARSILSLSPDCAGPEDPDRIFNILQLINKCSPTIVNLLSLDEETIINVLTALQATLAFYGKEAITPLVDAGLCEKLNRILLCDPHHHTVKMILSTLQQVVFSRLSEDTGRTMVNSLQGLANKLLSFLNNELALSSSKNYISVSNRALWILSGISLNHPTTINTRIFQEHLLSISQSCLRHVELLPPCCLLCSSLSASLDNRSQDSDIREKYESLQSISLEGLRRLLSSENLSWKAISLACIALNEQFVYKEKNSCQLNVEVLLEALVCIQNSLLDPLWTLQLKTLASAALNRILQNCGPEMAHNLASIEWFRILLLKGLAMVGSYTNFLDLMPWVLYLESTLHGPYWTIIFENKENLAAILELTYKSRACVPLLCTILEFWIAFLRENSSCISTECVRELRSFFLSVFKELPKECLESRPASNQLHDPNAEDNCEYLIAGLSENIRGHYHEEFFTSSSRGSSPIARTSSTDRNRQPKRVPLRYYQYDTDTILSIRCGYDTTNTIRIRYHGYDTDAIS